MPTLQNYSSLRILLVDDNMTNRLVASRLLGKMGAKVDSVEGGAAAIEACAKRKFDLIFMDCMMPEVDGFEATRSIREPNSENMNSETPIIALTANAMEGDREKCLQAGMSDYLPKPIRPKELQEILDKWMAKIESGQPDLAKEGSGGEPLIDLSSLKDVFGEDADELKPLVDAFVESLVEQLDAIRKNEDVGIDFETLRLHCHTIKGASANYGAKPLERLAKEVESACKAGRHDTALALIPNLKAMVKGTIEAANQSLS